MDLFVNGGCVLVIEKVSYDYEEVECGAGLNEVGRKHFINYHRLLSYRNFITPDVYLTTS